MAGSSRPALPDEPLLGALPPGLRRDQLVAATAAGLAGVPADATVVVALSGGPDSTALAFLVAEARPDLTLRLVHVRHGLRDDRPDLAAASMTAQFLGAPLDVVPVTVEVHGTSLEGAARAARHEALEAVARRIRARCILFGHTAEDQAETVLLRLARGTGVDGLGAMLVHDGLRCRPLLRVRRGDVHDFVRSEGLITVIDPSNADTRHSRNRLRAEVMPALQAVGPDVVGAMSRLAALAADDAQLLRDVTSELVADHVRVVGPVRSIASEVLASLPRAAARRVLRSMVRSTRPGDLPPTAAQVERIRTMARGGGELPGATVVAAGGWVTVAPAGMARPSQVDLVVDGRTAWPAAGWAIEATSDATASPSRAQLGLLGAWEPPRVRVHDALVAPGGIAARAAVVLGGLGGTLPPLQVRPRRPGDRIATAGGTRKLQDVFVDAGVPRPARDLVPVVVTGDRVLWVPGLVADDTALRTGRAIPQLHLVVRLLR